MGSNPINLFIRFLLEITALISAGMWGYKQLEGFPKYLLAIGAPLILAILWGVFAVPDDPSRSGNAPVPTPGWIRLILELAIFAFAFWCLLQQEYQNFGYLFGVVVLLHYLVSYDRVTWLLSK